VFSILFLSKFVILEAVNVVFGDHVDLGHFIEIVVLILTMLVASALLQFVYRKLGP
jgi:type IV secretory pathway VirB2 component (pilin)